MPRLNRFPRFSAHPVKFTASALLFVLALAGGTHAHPNGTSKVTVRLLGSDSLIVEVDANTSDMITAVGMEAMRPEVFIPADVRTYQARAAQYAYSRLAIRADNRAVLNSAVLSWKRGGMGPDDDLAGDSAAMWDTSIVITFGGRYPAGARMLNFGAALFPEFGMQSICQASVLWRDTLVERRWLVLDRTLRVPLSPDSLDARLALNRATPAAAAGDNLFARFTGLGFTHILPHGLDHILFVLGLFFFSTRMRPLLLQVTAFTVAHSITLALTLLGVFSLPGSVVEPLIALSIAVVGLENVFFRKVKASRWLIVFAFGLIHGMGFAGVLSELGLPEGGFWPALIGFNLGVEFGQLAVIALAFGLTVWFRNKPWYFKGVVVPVSLLISAVGLYWAIERVMGF
jgi:hydrogenase/urease accessory protein HupE